MGFWDKAIMWIAGIASLAGFLLAIPVFLLARARRNQVIPRWVPVLALICVVAFQGYMEGEIEYWLWHEEIRYLQMYRYSSPGSWWKRRDALWRYVMDRRVSSREPFVAFFLKHGASPGKGLDRLFFSLREYSHNGENEVLRLLLEAEADPDGFISANTPLEDAVIKRRFDLGRTLLRAGATVRSWTDDAGRSVLHLAAMGQADPTFLAELSAPLGSSAWQIVDRAGRTPVHYLSTPQQLELFSSSPELLRLPSRTGATLLHYSLQSGNGAVFDRLLEMGFEPDPLDASGCPPLAYVGDFATFSRLRAMVPPDFSWSVESRQQLWLRALQSGSEEFILAIMAEGVDPRLPLKNGNSPLHEVVRFGQAPRLIQILASAGADIQALNPKQDTPLHQAIQQRNATAASILLDLGASPRWSNAARQTPRSLAIQTLDAVKRMPRNLSANGIREEMEACRPWESLIRRLAKMSQIAEVESAGDEPPPPMESGVSGPIGLSFDSSRQSSSERERLCPTCGGSGSCQRCYGGGQVFKDASSEFIECPTCWGMGRCQTCDGKGKVK